jgi:SNF2 family DNA or RNA helicase
MKAHEMKEIIDNETGNYKMADFLRESLQDPGNKSLYVATGYFNIGGYGLLRDRLAELARRQGSEIRLLIGMEAVSASETEAAPPVLRSHTLGDYIEGGIGGDQNAAAGASNGGAAKGAGSGGEPALEPEQGGGALNAATRSAPDLPMSLEIDILPVDEEYARLVDDLISFLKNGNVHVRTNRDKFCHAKAYILDNKVVVGSSNMTAAGLSANVELNAVLYQPSAQQLVRDWFERRWSRAEDSKEELIRLLEESKFGLPADPYTMYMKFLYEYYRPRLEDLAREKGRLMELAVFQQDAVHAARRIIPKYGGVLLADSTGLGKTHIVLELLRHYVSVERKKALLIAPAQVLRGVWESRLMDESIKTKNITTESTGTERFHPEEYIDYDLVVIDESHNYRNASTKRYRNLMKLLSAGKRKKVILITATPVNNSLMDLYHQLSLITAGDDAHFADLGIPDMRSLFLRASQKGLSEGIVDILRLLDAVMIRRMRQFIKENYPNEKIGDMPVQFPERVLRKQEYSLTGVFGKDVYEQVLRTLDSLTMAPYRADYYRRTISDEERAEVETLSGLQRIGLLKRFESSIEAIRLSIERLIKLYDFFLRMLDEKRVLDAATFRKALAEAKAEAEAEAESRRGAVEETELEEADDRLIEKLRGMDLPPLTDEYDAEAMREDAENDLKLLRPLLNNLNKVNYLTDKKLIALADHLEVHKVFETDGRKCIIFTQYVDTAKYLHQQLSRIYASEKRVELLTGSTDEEKRDRIIKEFAPIANGMNPALVNQVDVLICTDVLSEGQNLQDANYVINYDLPWNPMKIVQRVGRIDRIGSRFQKVYSCIFMPEKELNDLLQLIEKLTAKIEGTRKTVGIDAEILGGDVDPKNFNAIARMRREDQKVLDDLERDSELLPAKTPFQHVWAYIKREGERGLASMPLGKRSGKRSDVNGIVAFYRERGSLESVHLVFYDLNRGVVDEGRYNDVSWIFGKLGCTEGEPLVIPFSGADAFRLFSKVDGRLKEFLVRQVNVPADVRAGRARVGAKKQRLLREIIMDAVSQEKVPLDEKTSAIFEILDKRNLAAWEDDFGEIIDTYNRSGNAENLLDSLALLFRRYRIIDEKSEGGKGKASSSFDSRVAKELKPEDLELIGYFFLTKEGFQPKIDAY